jgi:hypothetical protein
MQFAGAIQSQLRIAAAKPEAKQPAGSNQKSLSRQKDHCWFKLFAARIRPISICVKHLMGDSKIGHYGFKSIGQTIKVEKHGNNKGTAFRTDGFSSALHHV